MRQKLHIQAFGGLMIIEGRTPVQGFASRKAPALLVYLACNPRPYPREVLAELLWQDRSQSRSMANLRVVLSSLRELLEPYINITRSHVEFNSNAPHSVDVIDFESQIAAARMEWRQAGRLSRPVAEKLKKAIDIYEGDFLEGFYIKDSPDYEDWVSMQRERLRRQVIEALDSLAAYYLELEAEAYTDGRNPRFLGIEYANRSLHFDPLREATYRQLMMLHARLGQRSQAIERYETCRRLLRDELGVEPSSETQSLFQKIQSGELDPKRSTASMHTKRISPDAAPAPAPDINGYVYNPPTRKRPEIDPDQPALPAGEDLPDRPKMRVCRYCQYEIPAEDLKCPNCGKGAKTTVSLGYMEPEDGDSFFSENHILLMFMFGVQEPLRVIIPPAGNLIVGRTTEGIDLTPYDGLENGVSRRHAMVQRNGETLVISDQNSSNGTYLNGQKLYPHELRVLRHGDELRFGKLVSRMRFYRP